MFNEDQAKKENTLVEAQNKTRTIKNSSLSQTIQKIVRANNEFNKINDLKKSGNQNLKGDCNPFEISPAKIIFEVMSTGMDYIADFVVTNLTSKQKKIKIKLPKSNFFVFENSEVMLIAPGLQFHCKILYKARTLEEIQETFTVISDDFSVIVPISVFPPRGILSFDPTINLGFIQPETPITFNVNFSNKGQETMTIEFINNEEFSLISESFPMHLSPETTQTAVFEAIFQRTGSFKTCITITVQGKSEKHHIDLLATVVSHSHFLVDESGNEISVLNFEEILIGEERHKKVIFISNSPKTTQFKVQIIKGINNEHYRDQAKPQTPYDMGVELSEQVIFVDPAFGEIESYGYQVLNFRLKTSPTIDEKFLVSKFAISEPNFDQDNQMLKGKRSFNYTAFLSLNDQANQKSLQIFANAFCPLVNFSHQNIRFGDLQIGSKKTFELSVTNYNSFLPVVISTPHESFLHCNPKQLSLAAKETKVIQLEFAPKNLGIFNGKHVFRLNKCFDIKIDLIGSGISGNQSNLKTKLQSNEPGNYTLKIEEFENELGKSVKGENNQVILKGQKNTQPFFGRNNSVQNNPSGSQKVNLPQLGIRKLSNAWKGHIATKMTDLHEPIPVMSKIVPPIFVLKPVKNNEPNNLRSLGGKFIPDLKLVLKEFPSTPKDYEEIRQLSEKLTGEKLMRIQVGPTEIDFGKIFVNSTVSMSFQVKNDLWASIACGLNVEKIPELIGTSNKIQIIPSGKTAAFKVVINCPSPKNFREKVTYIINGFHTFNFIVNAEVIPVDLEPSKTVMNFKFKEDSLEMYTTDVVNLKNTGNSPAGFKIKFDNAHSPFKVLCNEGVVKENSSKDIEVIYYPAGIKDEDIMTIEIEKLGQFKTVKCLGIVNETSCEILQNNINFGNIAVGQLKSTFFSIKNSHNKSCTIFTLDESTVPEGVEIRPKIGKICPEDTQKIELEFLLRKKLEYKNHEIVFQIRGSSPLKVYLTVNTTIPNVEIEQTEFNFDKVTFGNKCSLPMDISNRSTIPAELYLNLSSPILSLQEKYDCIDIEYINKNNSDSIIFERNGTSSENDAENFQQTSSRNVKNQNEGKIVISANNLGSKQNEARHKIVDSKNKNEIESPIRSFIFYLKPNRTYNFNMVFSPIKPSIYDFELVFTTPGQETNKGIARRVYCMGTNPRFLMEPLSGVIEFARKIIISPETVIAEQKTLTISNPSFDEQLSWSLNTASIDTQNTFTITPSKGIIDPQCTVTLKISFRPMKPQIYDASVPLYIDNKTTAHSEIKIKGEGSFPKILFSTDEIILPSTPLNVASYGYIALINDGYQNSSFTASVPNEYLKLGLTIDFLNGNLLGINNQKIFLKISFTSSTPVAFTAKVNIEDDLKRSFSFSISGVSDNSLFSYGPFLSLGYFVNSMFRKSLDNFETIQSLDSDFKNCQSIFIDPSTKAPKFSLKNEKKLNEFSNANSQKDDSNSQKSLNANDDSDLLAIEYYNQVSNTIKCWLLEYGISNITHFPEDLQTANGYQFYEFLDFLLKSPPSKPILDPTLKNVDRVVAIVQNYYNLLNYLKENNAMVNNVRPYFLLSFKDLTLYYKVNQVSHLIPDYYKITDIQYKLLSLQSWTTLYLQAIKIFFVSRITVKEFKTSLLLLSEKKKKEVTVVEEPNDSKQKQKESAKNMPKTNLTKGKKSTAVQDNLIDTKESNPQEIGSEDKESSQILNKIMPEYQYDKNSLFSTSEALLLRWLEVLYEMKTKEAVRITHFGKELQNCFYFSCAVDIYTGNETLLCQKIKQNVFLNDEISSNLEHFKKVLYDFGIKEEFFENDFINLNPIGMLLMTVHLFKTLPPYVPRSTIEFNCSLHEKMTKEISLSNPSPKTIIYSVKLFGPKNFGVESDTIKIDGKQTIAIPVTFYAKTSFPVEGKIFFQNRKNGKSVAGAIVFLLKATVVNRFSMRTFSIINVNLYEIGNSEITITNPFDRDVDFKIKIENTPIIPEQTLKTKDIKKTIKNEQVSLKEEKSQDFVPSFFIKQDRIWIRKGAVSKLYVQYLPVTFETHRCLLIFLDTKVGEMQYELIGTPKPPVSIDSFKITVPIENFNNVELSLPFKNSFFHSALAKLSDRIKESKDFSYLPILEKMASNVETIFDIEIFPPEFFSCASPVNLAIKQPNDKNHKGSNINTQDNLLKGQNQQGNLQKTHAQFSAPSANQLGKLVLLPIKKIPLKDLHLSISLKGKQKFDYRFYDLNLTVLPKTIKATIEIKTTARIPVTQNIPVTNNTDFECTIKPSFNSQFNGHLFDMPLSMFQIKKKSVINFPLKFISNWIEKAEGKLTLFNTTTNDNFEYMLKVECDEPLSENHEEIYTKAKKMTTLTVKIKNPISESRSFKVECDIPDSDFPKKMVFEDSKGVDFKINFIPIIGGSFMYSLTFTDDNGKYFWYLITAHVDSPEPMKIFSVTTEIRKPTVCKIEINNSTDKIICYKTMLVGEFLTGDNLIEIPANSKENYYLYYFPLKIESVRKKIGFLSDEEGEIWYDIDCRSEETKTVKLPTFKAELGKSVSQQLTFKNPLKKKSFQVHVEQNENSNFTVNPKKFQILPNESFVVEITYVPRDLNKNEMDQLTFVSTEIGDWKYQVFGQGISPTEFEPTSISTTLGKPLNKTFSFKNPFNQEMNFSIYIECLEGLKEVFEMINPKSKTTLIPALTNYQILLKFNPTEIFTYKAKLIIKANDLLQWTFPIVGITEAIQSGIEFNIRAKCGSEMEASNKYILSGITNLGVEETIEHSLKINHLEGANIEKWLKIKPIKNKINNPSEEVEFSFNFLPHKPFKTTVEFILSKPSGGRWKFKIVLIASEPDFFDTLNIISQLNVRKTIQFRLFNSDKKNSSPFTAYYTQDSDSEFMVNPSKGILEPAINDGTIIEISYLPTQYGKAKTGVLIVETEHNFWRFLVKGMFEKYVPPK